MATGTDRPEPDRFGPLHLGQVLLLIGSVLLLVGGWWINTHVEPLPDFERDGPVEVRKQAFFDYLAPRIRQVNAEVLAERQRLLALEARLEDGRPAGFRDRRWLRQRAVDYELEPDPDRSPAETVALLKPRIDIVPPELALVQAAVESGWGRSRFARQANNLFGHWCYEAGCGLVPRDRTEGARHEVAAFESPRQSVERYLHNLNTHPPYRPFRQRRAAARAAGETPRALDLVNGLLRYSERREAYVDEIRSGIRTNRTLIDAALNPGGADT